MRDRSGIRRTRVGAPAPASMPGAHVHVVKRLSELRCAEPRLGVVRPVAEPPVSRARSTRAVDKRRNRDGGGPGLLVGHGNHPTVCSIAVAMAARPPNRRRRAA